MQKNYEHHSEPLLPRPHFFLRLVKTALQAIGMMGVALGVGVVGYHHFGKLQWIDALVDASMILGGMGPVNPITTTAGKLFASFYALFSGIVFLTMSAILVAPVLHRLLHRLHIKTGE